MVQSQWWKLQLAAQQTHVSAAAHAAGSEVCVACQHGVQGCGSSSLCFGVVGSHFGFTHLGLHEDQIVQAASLVWVAKCDPNLPSWSFVWGLCIAGGYMFTVGTATATGFALLP